MDEDTRLLLDQLERELEANEDAMRKIEVETFPKLLGGGPKDKSEQQNAEGWAALYKGYVNAAQSFRREIEQIRATIIAQRKH